MPDSIGLIVPDLHAPYHDDRAFQLLLKAGRYLHPRFLVDLGDFIDNYSISDHMRDPRRKLHFKDEVGVARGCRKQLDSLGAEQKLFTKGNHEWRYDRHVISNAPELYETCGSIEELLEFPQNGWDVVEYGDFGKIGKMHFTHDVDGKAGKNAHSDACQDFAGNVVIGHTHRLLVGYSGNLRHESHVGITMGWLGDAKKADYKHRAKALKEWHLAFGVAFLAGNGNMLVQPIPIINYSACVGGKWIVG